jgi:hypothetical protein
VKGLPRLVRRERSIAASEYDTFAPKHTVSRKAHTPGKGDEDPMPDAGVVWCPAGGQVQQLARRPAGALSMAGRSCADVSTSR